jgi:glucose-6-phosphate isomerase
MGALYFAMCTLTAITGTLMGVNPFDQPGVEEGKVYIRESLERVRRDIQDQEESNRAVDRLRRPTQD